MRRTRPIGLRPAEEVSLIESQQGDVPRFVYPSRHNVDVANLARIRTSPASSEKPDDDVRYRHIIRPGRVRHTDWGLKILANDIDQWVQIIPQNDHRRRFILINDAAQTVVTTVYWSFGPSNFSRIPLAPGALWDESGSEVADDPIFVFSPVAGVVIGAWEGIPLDRDRDEYRQEGRHK